MSKPGASGPFLSKELTLFRFGKSTAAKLLSYGSWLDLRSSDHFLPEMPLNCHGDRGLRI